tara:strand:- start:2 stop:343 length:342 start_codon:yes stop_codon:yes gene_type:complete
MNTIPIKPLSVNRAWKGRRFKTAAYKKYEIDVYKLLPRKLVIPDGDLAIALEFGFSSSLSDFDNPVKMFVDILQKKYQFNDNRIMFSVIVKKHVKKGQEYTKFAITSLDEAIR